MTVRVAMAGAALLPLSVCKAPAGSELVKLPATGAVTCAVTVQEPLAGIAPSVRPTTEGPMTNHSGEDNASARTLPAECAASESIQLLLTLLAITSRPLGNVSMNCAVRLAGVLLALLKVMVRVETPPALILAGLKDLPSVGGT